MARGIGAGIAELWYVAAIADPAAPTALELNAGVDLTSFLTDGGLTTPLDGSIVDAGDMSSKFNKTASGTFGGQPLSAEFYRDLVEADDTAFTTLPFGTQGFFALSRRGLAAAGTWAAADYADIWPIDVITANPAPLARNEMQRFTCEAAVPDVPSIDVSVA